MRERGRKIKVNFTRFVFPINVVVKWHTYEETRFCCLSSIYFGGVKNVINVRFDKQLGSCSTKKSIIQIDFNVECVLISVY